jgi:hypothetical protein
VADVALRSRCLAVPLSYQQLISVVCLLVRGENDTLQLEVPIVADLHSALVAHGGYPSQLLQTSA